MKKWINRLHKNSNAIGARKCEENTDGEEDRALDQNEMQTDAAETVKIDTADEIAKKIVLKKSKSHKEKKPWSVRKKAIIFCVVGVFAALLITGGVWALNIISNPLGQFPNEVSSKPSGIQAETSQQSGEVTPTPTVDPEALLLSEADLSILDSNYINIMLIGVDQSEERQGDEWKGKTDFHSDVMIVLTINKTTHEVSMISLPRDTYAKIPDVDGIYKLNASINCGGGWCEEGFKKVCQAAQWMLGGDGTEEDPIQIDYYFAVDMNAVKDLADSIGGVDYDLDISFTIQGRSYTKGQQHMDGQGVLDYLRVRKEASGTTEGISEEDADSAIGDKNRVNRQKNMLVAIFEKIKDNGLLASIPNLISAFDGNLEYNMTVSQIAALAYFALKYVDPDTIQMYSMSGSYVKLFEPYAFTFTSQSNRIDIIQKVYNVTVSARSYYTMSAAKLRWGKLQARHYIKITERILNKAQSLLEADAMLPEEPTPTQPPEASETPTTSESALPSESTTTVSGMSFGGVPPVEPVVATGDYRKYGDAEWALYNTVVSEYEELQEYDSYHSGDDLLALLEKYQADVIALCNTFGISAPLEDDWLYDYVNDLNDIYVDFR